MFFSQLPEARTEYINLASSRQYEGDSRLVAGKFDDRLHHFHKDETLSHAGDNVYGFLESIGARLIPHGSQGGGALGPPDASSIVRGDVGAEGEGELDRGGFYDHLVGHEQCLREWQKVEGSAVIDDSLCLAGLFHSLYGTQGYQASRFPVEKRAQVAELIGERAERLVFWNCAMERSTWREMVLANKDRLQQVRSGQAPVGSFSGRQTARIGGVVQRFAGVWPADGPHKQNGEESWTMTSQEFTDMCALQLSHVLGQANSGEVEASLRDDPVFQIYAELLGGAANEQFRAPAKIHNKTQKFLPRL